MTDRDDSSSERFQTQSGQLPAGVKMGTPESFAFMFPGERVNPQTGERTLLKPGEQEKPGFISSYSGKQLSGTFTGWSSTRQEIISQRTGQPLPAEMTQAPQPTTVNIGGRQLTREQAVSEIKKYDEELRKQEQKLEGMDYGVHVTYGGQRMTVAQARDLIKSMRAEYSQTASDIGAMPEFGVVEGSRFQQTSLGTLKGVSESTFELQRRNEAITLLKEQQQFVGKQIEQVKGAPESMSLSLGGAAASKSEVIASLESQRSQISSEILNIEQQKQKIYSYKAQEDAFKQLGLLKAAKPTGDVTKPVDTDTMWLRPALTDAEKKAQGWESAFAMRPGGIIGDIAYPIVKDIPGVGWFFEKKPSISQQLFAPIKVQMPGQSKEHWMDVGAGSQMVQTGQAKIMTMFGEVDLPQIPFMGKEYSGNFWRAMGTATSIWEYPLFHPVETAVIGGAGVLAAGAGIPAVVIGAGALGVGYALNPEAFEPTKIWQAESLAGVVIGVGGAQLAISGAQKAVAKASEIMTLREAKALAQSHTDVLTPEGITKAGDKVVYTTSEGKMLVVQGKTQATPAEIAEGIQVGKLPKGVKAASEVTFDTEGLVTRFKQDVTIPEGFGDLSGQPVTGQSIKPVDASVKTVFNDLFGKTQIAESTLKGAQLSLIQPGVGESVKVVSGFSFTDVQTEKVYDTNSISIINKIMEGKALHGEFGSGKFGVFTEQSAGMGDLQLTFGKGKGTVFVPDKPPMSWSDKGLVRPGTESFGLPDSFKDIGSIDLPKEGGSASTFTGQQVSAGMQDLAGAVGNAISKGISDLGISSQAGAQAGSVSAILGQVGQGTAGGVAMAALPKGMELTTPKMEQPKMEDVAPSFDLRLDLAQVQLQIPMTHQLVGRGVSPFEGVKTLVLPGMDQPQPQMPGLDLKQPQIEMQQQLEGLGQAQLGMQMDLQMPDFKMPELVPPPITYDWDWTPPTGEPGGLPTLFKGIDLGLPKGFGLPGGKQKTAYKASLAGIVADLRIPKEPKRMLTGIEIRPMVQAKVKRPRAPKGWSGILGGFGLI